MGTIQIKKLCIFWSNYFVHFSNIIQLRKTKKQKIKNTQKVNINRKLKKEK